MLERVFFAVVAAYMVLSVGIALQWLVTGKVFVELDTLLRAQVRSALNRIIDRLESTESPYPPQERGKDANELRNIVRKL